MFKRKTIVGLVFVLAMSLAVTGCFNDNNNGEDEEVKQKQQVNEQVDNLEQAVASKGEEQVEKSVASEGITVKLPDGEIEKYSREEFSRAIKDNKELWKLFDIKNRTVDITGDTAVIKGTVGNQFADKLSSLDFSSEKNNNQQILKVEGMKTYHGTNFKLDYPTEWVNFNYGEVICGEQVLETVAVVPRDAQAYFFSRCTDGNILEADTIANLIRDVIGSVTDLEVEKSKPLTFKGETEAYKLVYNYNLSYRTTGIKIKTKKQNGQWYIVEIKLNSGEKKTITNKTKIITATHGGDTYILAYLARSGDYAEYLPTINQMIDSFQWVTEKN